MTGPNAEQARFLVQLLRSAQCPDPNCSDGSIRSTGPDPQDDACQWCHQRHETIKAFEPGGEWTPQVGEFEWALQQGGVLADWCNVSGAALKAMMDAYERRIRSLCTPEQIAQEPWRCAEFIQAERALASKPVPVVTIPAIGKGA